MDALKKEGFNYPVVYLLPRFAIWVRSGYVVWPDGGCYDSQPKRLIDDFNRLNRRYGIHLRRERPSHGE